MRRKGKNLSYTDNVRLFPRLKRRPSKRSIGKKFLYVPGMLTKVDGIREGGVVAMLEPPGNTQDKTCVVQYSGEDFRIFWKDLVRVNITE